MSDNEFTFVFDRESKVYIYGAATIGGTILKTLLNSGVSVKGFLDKRAQEIESYYDFPVYDITDEITDKNDAIVIIAVKNVFEHSRIASKLRDSGFRRIIYRPYNALSNSDDNNDENRLNECYDIITEKGVSSKTSIHVPVIFENNSIGEKISGVFKIDDKFMVVYVPVTMVFTDHKNNAPEFSILYMKPHINFIQFVLGRDGGEYESYLNYCELAAKKAGDVKITDSWRQNVIRNRAEVIANMNHRLNVDNSFFIKNAPKAIWNTKKQYFNLDSGKHRAIFLATCGYDYIPLKVTSSDYESYLHYKDIKYLRTMYFNKYEKGCCPITENPYFTSESWIYEPYWFGFLREIMKEIRNNIYIDSCSDTLNSKSALIKLQDSEYIKCFFEKMGIKVDDEKKKDHYHISIICDEYCDFDENADLSFVISKKNELDGYSIVSSWIYKGEIIRLFMPEGQA